MMPQDAAAVRIDLDNYRVARLEGVIAGRRPQDTRVICRAAS
jgi:hypothetical protein